MAAFSSSNLQYAVGDRNATFSASKSSNVTYSVTSSCEQQLQSVHPRQHLRSSTRSPSAAHLRAVSMSVQHQARVSAAAASATGRTLEALATTAETDIDDIQHRPQQPQPFSRSISDRVHEQQHTALCVGSGNPTSATPEFYFLLISQQSGENFIPAIIDRSQQFCTAATFVSRWPSALVLVLLCTRSSHSSLYGFQTAPRTS